MTTASGITGLAGMKGKIVAVDTGSTGDMWATQNQAKYSFDEIRRYEGLNPAMLDLAGRPHRRLHLSDIPALLYYTKDKPQFNVVERIQSGEKYSIMFAKDAPLARGQRHDHAEEGRFTRPPCTRRGSARKAGRRRPPRCSWRTCPRPS